jgi:plasmid stabilization system protein ParE
VATIELSEETTSDFERILTHLEQHEVERPLARLEEIIAAIDVLATSPYIGSPVADGQRELIIGRRSHGYIARYAYDPVRDLVRVVAIRHQREGDR